MATGAVVALKRDDGATGLGQKQLFVEIEQVLVAGFHFRGDRFALDFQFVGPALQHTNFVIGGFHQGGDAVFFRIEFGLGRGDGRLEVFGLLHQFEFTILDDNNVLLGPLDLVLQRGVFLVLAGLQLLGAVFGDLPAFGVRLDLKALALHLDFFGAGFVAFQLVLRTGELLLQKRFFARHGMNFVEKSLQPLVSLLQEEKFLQNFHH